MTIQLRIKIIQAIEGAGNFFCTMTATMSIPPVLPPSLNANAMAAPIPIPPARAANIFSSKISCGIFRCSMTVSQTVCMTTLSMERIANFFFTQKKERISKGALIQKIEMLCGTFPWVAFSTMMAIPVTPPVAKLLGAIRQ